MKEKIPNNIHVRIRNNEVLKILNSKRNEGANYNSLINFVLEDYFFNIKSESNLDQKNISSTLENIEEELTKIRKRLDEFEKELNLIFTKISDKDSILK